MRERARTGESRQVRLGELISVLLHEDLADEPGQPRRTGLIRLASLSGYN